MREQVLYDKVISVTLYKKTTPQRTIRVHKTMGYGETRVKGKRVLFSSRVGSTIDNMTSKLQQGVVATVEFYEGNSYYTSTNTKDGKNKYVRHMATGPLYKYNTMEEMEQGIHPDGSLMRTGDRAYVLENRKTWTAVVTGSEEALLDSVVTSEAYDEKITIECPESGLKPDMTFSVNLLPGQNCYKAVLRIKNLNIKNADIRMWDRMEIVAGYRSGTTARFICPIFASYIESPNPDGITVFEGITVGKIESQMYNKLVEIEFLQEEMTLLSLIEGVAKGITGSTRVKSALTKEQNELKISLSRQKVYAENGLAVLNWLQTIVASTIEEASNGRSSVFVQLSGNELEVIVINGENAIPYSTEDIVSLNMVSGATFNGTALTVEAPWNPDLKPNDLFFMPPQFIQGSHLPNVLAEADYRNVDNLYRALTMSLIFGTTDGNNKMTILAVPAQYAGQMSMPRTTEMLPEDYAALKTAELEMSKTPIEPLKIGTLDGVEKAAMKVVTKKTGLSMFDTYKGFSGSLFAFTTLDIDKLTTGGTLSQIGEYYCYTYGNGPHLDRDRMGTDNSCGTYHMNNEELKRVSALAASHPQNAGIPCYVLWWPLIAIATYWRWQEDLASGVSNNWMHIILENPNYIENGKSLLVPVFNGYNTLRTIKDVYKNAYLDYKDFPGYASYVTQWRAMYYMLGGTDDIG